MTKSPRDPEASYTQEVTPRPTKNLDASSQDASKIPVLQDKPKPSQPAFVSFCALYRYASPSDLLCLVVGLLAAASAGALAPCTALVFGNAVASFQRPDGGVDSHAINKAAIEYVVLAGLLFLADYLAYVLLMHSAERQMHALRLVTLKHMLFMDMSWFDAQTTSALSSRLTGDTVKIKDGMGYKLGLTVKHTSQFATGSVIAFVKGWDMALVMWCVMPFTVWSLRVLITTTIARAVQSQVMYSQAHAIAEETLGSIRTVAAMTAERQAIAKYNAQIAEAEATAIKQERVNALVKGFVMGGSWVMYAAGLWYGGSRVADAARSPSEMFQGFFAMLFGAGSLAQISTNLTTVTQARGIAAAIYGILATDSAVDASKRDGVVPDTCLGRIEAVDVHFAYPSRPDMPVLHAYNVVIEPGHTVAFVGASGEGKSTLVALLERFYSPQQGAIMLDGRDLRTLNITWLRSQIGLVSQEPVLFGRSIFENIAIGSSSSVTRDQVVHAARVANAHDFIVALPQQYDTPVGEMGVALSGGQKQRLAIARAIVRDPKILVLDEATSALDAESESCVQDSLKQLLTEKGRTTIVIAHRLSTIRHADKIVVVSNGQVIEQGRHADLLVINNGIYRKLYTKQVEKTQDGGSGVVETEIPVQSTLKDVVEGIQPLSPTSAQTIPVKVPTFSVHDALQLPRQDIPYFALAVMAIAVSALALPGSSLLISAMANSLALQFAKYEVSLDRSYLDKLADDVTLYGVCYIAGSSAVFLTTATHTYCFGYISERVLARLRSRHFTALCRQDIAFYDDPNHTTGALSADLSIHANKVAAITGSVLGGVVDAVWTFLAALLISFVLGSWKLSLVMLAIVPLLMVAGAVRSNHLRAQRGHADDLAVVGAHASEALTSIRTVASFGLEDRVIERFHYLLRDLLHQGRAEAQINGLAIGFASFVVYAAQGLAFWYGGKLVDQREISFLELMRSLMAIMMAANGIGYVLTFLGDAEKARKAGGEIISVCSRQPVIDSFDERGLVPATVEGAIQFKDVSFRYPSRPSVQVLQKYNLTIAAGETVAFCGPSGGGKSTCLALLERFYDPDGGTVFLDGHDLRQLNVHWLRRQIGLVSQEPTLFSGTIAENIAYGCDHEPSQEQVEAAAAVANAHGFITQFPDGYATAVGAKGEQLSGGQKQRIAIARAVLKNPMILLLDEATSALDMESEVVVQAALDNAMRLRRRTTLIIAHRLSTIRSANRICVVSGGTIVEQGTHGELLVRGGVYSALVEAAST